jgi:hypothetical protein
MESKIKWYVYVMVNLINGKLYFGVHHGDPEKLDYFGNGIRCASDAERGDQVFKRAVKKYGLANFRRTIISIFPYNDEGKKQAFDLEKAIVTPTLLKSKNVYNMTQGGGGNPPVELKRVYKFALNGNFLCSYASCGDAAHELNVKNAYSAEKAIRNNCLGTTKCAFGFYWSYTKEFGYTGNKRLRKVAQYTVKGRFIRYFDSITEAEDTYQICNIEQAIRKNYLSGGYQWRYYEGDDSDIEPLVNIMTRTYILPIVMWNDAGIFKHYESVKACVNENSELITSEINKVLKGKMKTHRGWHFKYDDSQDKDIVST